jgi:hypothetical protein
MMSLCTSRIAIFATLIAVPVLAATDPNDAATAETVQTLASVPVAIFDFESTAPGNPEFGRQLADILTARLSVYDQFTLVERKHVNEAIPELQLSLSGLVEPGRSTQVGRMIGARILVFGRAFAVDRDLYLVAKVVGTETSQVKGIIAKGKLESDLSPIIDQLVEKLVEGLGQWAAQLLPRNEKLETSIETLRLELAGRTLPTVAVIVSESHMRTRSPDPAAATEVKKVFKEAGFEVLEADRDTLEKWTKNVTLAGCDIVITGEGVSDFAARIGGLVSCVGRLELQATRRDSGRIVAVKRTTRRAVDLSETIAAKTALQSAGHELAIALIREIAAETTPPAEAKQ